MEALIERTAMPNGRIKPLLRAVLGETMSRTPWWLMRQADRYLPEYREIRARTRDFIELCLSPKLAAEVTIF
jgi:uroporphyrinogen decarboxylase